MSGWIAGITAVVGAASQYDASRRQKNQAKDAANAAQQQAQRKQD